MPGCFVFGCSVSSSKKARDENKNNKDTGVNRDQATKIQQTSSGKEIEVPSSSNTFSCGEARNDDPTVTLESAVPKKATKNGQKNQSKRRPSSEKSGAEYAQLFQETDLTEAPLTGSDNKNFSFPNELVQRNKWIRLSGRKKEDFYDSAVMCSNHFAKEQYDLVLLEKRKYNLKGIRVLLPTAIPSLSLPFAHQETPAQAQRNIRALLKRKRESSTKQSTKRLAHQSSTSTSNETAAETDILIDGHEVPEINSNLNDRGDEYGSPDSSDQNRSAESSVSIQSTTRTPSQLDESDIICNRAIVSLYKNIQNQEKVCQKLPLNNNTIEKKVSVERSLILDLNELVICLTDSLSTTKHELEELRKTCITLRKRAERAENAAKKSTLDNDTIKKELQNSKAILESERKSWGDIFSLTQIARILHHKQVRWTSDDYNNAVVLACISSRAYNHARDRLKLPLPHITSVKRYLSRFHCGPGLMTPVLKMIEARGQNMTEKEKIVVCSFDEVNISRNICYYRKQDRVLGPHRNAQVVYVKSLFGKWGNPVWYDYDTKVTRKLVDYISKALYEAGYTTVAWVSDLSPSNQGFHSELGISLDSQDFSHPVTNNKQYVFSDSPHDMKNSRNHLFDNGAVLNPSSPRATHQIACKEPLEQLLKPTPGAELLPHSLTWIHLEAREQDRQKVYLAAHTMSGKTATCLEEAGDSGKIKSAHYKSTSYFIKKVNEWFDQFNVKEDLREKVHSNSCDTDIPYYKLPFGAKFEEQRKNLEEIAEMVENMRFYVKGRTTLKKSLLPFQQGIIYNCRALISLYLDLKDKFPEEEILIMTWNLSQDCLEILFSILRALGVTYTCPTAVDLPYRMTRHAVMKNPHECLQGHRDKLNVEVHVEMQSVVAETLSELQFTAGGVVDDISDDEDDMEFEEFEGDYLLYDADDCVLNDSNEEHTYEGLIPSDSPNSPERKSYKDGILGLASIVAHRLKSKCPELSAKGGHSCSLPQYVEPFAKKGRSCPSTQFAEVALKMDEIFYAIHGEGINKIKGVTKLFDEKVRSAKLDVSIQAVKLFGWLRLCVRLRCLNVLKWRGRSDVLLANQAAKLDKNSRAVHKAKHWSQ